MNHLGHKLLLGLFVATILIGSLPETTSAAKVVFKSETPVTAVSAGEKKLLDATVNLYCQIKVGNKSVSSTGTGVMIDGRGVILTNAHVAQYFLLNGEDSKLKANCSVRTGSPAKESYEAEVLYISKGWLDDSIAKSKDKSLKTTGEGDFALLYITEAKKGSLPATHPVLPLDTFTQISKGSEVKVAGYPSSNLKFKEVRSKLKLSSATTTITSLQTFGVNTIDTIALYRTKFASSGVSGGPVVLANSLIGIITLRSSSISDEGSSLRAITTSYIDRTIMSETGLTLSTLLVSDFAKRATETRANISAKAFSAIEKSLRVLR